MSCSKTLPVRIKENDTPLDQAIYSSANNAIYAVSGQRIFKYSATTGLKIAEAVLKADGLGHSSICDFNGVIYASVCFSQLTETQTGPDRPNDLYTINPITLAPTNTNLWSAAYSDVNYPFWGPIQIVAGGSYIYGVGLRNSYNLQLFRTDGVTIVSTLVNAILVGDAWPLCFDLSYAAAYDELLMASPLSSGNGLVGSYYVNPGFPTLIVDGAMYSFDKDTVTPFTTWPVGVCYCPSNDKVYSVEASSLVYYYSWALNTPKTVINTGVATANPRRIKYNSNDGLIYVPGWASNSVIVIDPATNTVQSEKTGFYLPWDVVFTPTKKWAVQNSSQGLREIT